VPLLAKRLTQRQAINVQTRAAFTLPALPYPVVSGGEEIEMRWKPLSALLSLSECEHRFSVPT
jgi:hypothetical protein